MTLPTKDELHTKAVSGEEITEGLVDELTKDEAPEGGNPPAGGVAGEYPVSYSQQSPWATSSMIFSTDS